MKFIARPKRQGKSIDAAKLANQTGSYLLVASAGDAHRMSKFTNRFPVTIHELLATQMSTGGVRDLVIDDLDRILAVLFPKHKVHLVTFTVDGRSGL